MAAAQAVLGGGCFWCVEAVYKDVRGVTGVLSGYAGGLRERPSYEHVCTGTTGHAEVVQVTYDTAVLSYADLLRIFFSIHDPTTRNQQGADVGTQYRSVIFVASDEERRSAEAIRAEIDAAAVWDGEIVTEIADLPDFYPAEAEHHDYFARHPDAGYCQVVIAPKLAKFREQFANRLRQGAA